MNMVRKGSAEMAIPHTRIADDAMITDNYDVGRKLGEGNFGKVYVAMHRATGVEWAIKSINKEKAGSSALKLVEREVTILKRVKHPNIINLNEVIESPKRMYLVMELCTKGELADRLKENKLFSEEETKTIMMQLSSAISYLHKHGIVHRDLKLENILMAVDPDDPLDKLHLKVTDFGLSVVKGGVTPDNMMQDFCGTPIYMAPEILDNKTYSQQCDVWALGIIMYTLICGYPPFRAKDEASLYDLIREANVQFDDDMWKSVSVECKNCILGMLKVDPAHRLSAAEVLNHPWITGQERDTNQPTNVLEMMKMWKDELKQDTDAPEQQEVDFFQSNNFCDKSPKEKSQVETVGSKSSSASSSKVLNKRMDSKGSPSTSAASKAGMSKKPAGSSGLSTPVVNKTGSRLLGPSPGHVNSKSPSKPISASNSKCSDVLKTKKK